MVVDDDAKRLFAGAVVISNIPFFVPLPLSRSQSKCKIGLVALLISSSSTDDGAPPALQNVVLATLKYS